MFIQTKKNKNLIFFHSNFFSRNRKGVSPMIGYILLVTFVIVLGVLVYGWMKTYIPQNELNCPDGTSLFIKDYACSNSSLNLTIKNNGKFSVGGYFLYASTLPDQELATEDLTYYLTENYSMLAPSGIKFSGEFNSLLPNSEEIDEFNLINFEGTIYSIELVPIRWQKEGRVNRIVSCQDSRIKESISC